MEASSTMNKGEKAVSCFMKGYNCSQAVLSTYSSQFGLDRETALKISTGFGGGMALLGETCGAVTGAFMVIGLKHGRIKEEDIQSKEITYEKVQEFANQFKSIHGSIKCKELIGCDINTPEGINVARNQNLFKKICPKYVKDAVEILSEIL